jgi:hypothetical protein
VLGSWVDESGNELVSDGWETDPQLGPMLCMGGCTNRIAAAEGTFAALAPNNQDAVLAPGKHTIDVLGFRQEGFSLAELTDQEVYVTVHAKVRGTPPTTGTLDLNLHFTGAGGWTAENAPTNEEVQEMLDHVGEIYAQVGITVGDVQYFDVDPRYRMLESTMGSDSDMMELLDLAADGRRNALNVYFVDTVMAGGPFGGFGVVLGIAGGIPGPPLVQGDPRGGVVIAVESHADPRIPGEVFTTMAHEVGHFLGLFHTSEQAFFGPQFHDPLADTPENDDEYLMFNTGVGNKLSEWQGRVMRSNPWVTHEEGQP